MISCDLEQVSGSAELKEEYDALERQKRVAEEDQIYNHLEITRDHTRSHEIAGAWRRKSRSTTTRSGRG